MRLLQAPCFARLPTTRTLCRLLRGYWSPRFPPQSRDTALPRTGSGTSESERSLSRLHALLSTQERLLVFDIYERYNRRVFEDFEVLDTDDVALSSSADFEHRSGNSAVVRRALTSYSSTRRSFSMRTSAASFPLLTRGLAHHVPIVLALDQAQEIFGQTSAGLGALGSPTSRTSPSQRTIALLSPSAGWRSSSLQRTTDLFSADFPNFTTGSITSSGVGALPGDTPRLIRCNEEARDFGKFVLRQLRELRRSGYKQLVVVCHAERLWSSLESSLRSESLPLHVLNQRGEEIRPDQYVVVLTRPAYVGGQEFRRRAFGWIGAGSSAAEGTQQRVALREP